MKNIDRSEISDAFRLIRYLNIILSSLIWNQYGLAYDIMTSGDYCGDFKGLLKYVRKYWFSYLLVSILINLPFFLFDFKILNIPIYFTFLYHFGVEFLFLLLFIEVFPIITAKGNIKSAIIDSIQLLKTDFFRIFLTWSIYFIIFIIPVGTLRMDFHFLVGLDRFTSSFIKELLISMIFFISNPLKALIATRILNTNDFKTKQLLVYNINSEDSILDY